MQTERLISIDEMTQLLNIDRRTLWKWHAKRSVFPSPIKNNGRTIGWPETVYQNWLNTKKAETLK